jgi:hypothetical protein
VPAGCTRGTRGSGNAGARRGRRRRRSRADFAPARTRSPRLVVGELDPVERDPTADERLVAELREPVGPRRETEPEARGIAAGHGLAVDEHDPIERPERLERARPRRVRLGGEQPHLVARRAQRRAPPHPRTSRCPPPRIPWTSKLQWAMRMGRVSTGDGCRRERGRRTVRPHGRRPGTPAAREPPRPATDRAGSYCRALKMRSTLRAWASRRRRVHHRSAARARRRRATAARPHPLRLQVLRPGDPAAAAFRDRLASLFATMRAAHPWRTRRSSTFRSIRTARALADVAWPERASPLVPASRPSRTAPGPDRLARIPSRRDRRLPTARSDHTRCRDGPRDPHPIPDHTCACSSSRFSLSPRAAGVVVGCSILEPNTDESRASQPRTEAETDEAAEQRHGMALLRDLLEKQTQVDGSLWVIDESDGLEKLVDDIAAASTRSLDALRASFSRR